MLRFECFYGIQFFDKVFSVRGNTQGIVGIWSLNTNCEVVREVVHAFSTAEFDTFHSMIVKVV